MSSTDATSGALFIATLAAERLPSPTYPPVTSLDTVALSIQPITYFLVLTSILCQCVAGCSSRLTLRSGLSIPFFTLGKRVHSISRTWTSGSGNGPEPSWLSRVRRVGDPRDVEVNRDDNGEKRTNTQDSDETIGGDLEKGLSGRDFADEEKNAAEDRLLEEDRQRIADAKADGAQVWDEGNTVRPTSSRGC